jgi:hypothetical protein
MGWSITRPLMMQDTTEKKTHTNLSALDGNDLYSSSNIKVTKSRRIRWAGGVALM